MRRLKTGTWRAPPVSKNDLGVGTLLVTAERKSEIPLLPGRSLIFAHASTFFLSEASGVSVHFNNYFN